MREAKGVKRGRLTSPDAIRSTNMVEASPPQRWEQILCPWMLIVTTWSVMLFAFVTNHSALVDHDYLLRTSGLPWPLALVVFLFSWQIMIAAMMLPSTLSMILMIGAINRRPLWLSQLTFIGGYALVWTLFALLAFLGDTMIHYLLDNWRWLYIHSWLLGVTILALAGVFQFSPLKQYYLRQCSSPAALCERYRLTGMRSLWLSGVRYGVLCLGSCWAIMLVMFGIGMKSLWSIVALSIVILVEKEFAGWRFLRFMIGVGFLLMALFWLVFV